MRKMLLVALAMCLILAACGRGEQKSDETQAAETEKAAQEENIIPPPVALPGRVENRGTLDRSFQGANADVDMEIDNFYFDPTFVRTAPGATVTLRLHNEGTVEHTFNVDSPAIEHRFEPGDRRTVEVRLPQSGVVNFYCKLHRSQGMQGAFYVKDPAPPQPAVPGAGQSTVSPEQQGAIPGGATPEAGM